MSRCVRGYEHDGILRFEGWRMAVLAGGARGGEDDGIWMMEFDGGILTVGCPLIRQCSVQSRKQGCSSSRFAAGQSVCLLLFCLGSHDTRCRMAEEEEPGRGL